MQLTTNSSSWQEKAITLIKNAEGFRDTAYIDSMGNKTIGYGFNLSLPFFSNIGDTITKPEADTILRDFCSQEVFLYVPNPDSPTPIGIPHLNNNQCAVIADMIYNLGIGQFNSFTTLKGFLASGDTKSAAADLVGTEWFKQVGLRGIRNILNLIVNDNFLYVE